MFEVNKGINKPVEFKGFKAQYIYYLAGGVLGMVILYTILYSIGLPTYLVALVAIGGFAGYVYYLSIMNKKHGEHGLKKATANARQPKAVTVRSTKVFKVLRK